MLSNLNILKLVKEVIENADKKFQDWLEDNTEMFCQIIENDLLKSDQKIKSLRWDDLIILSEWKKQVLDFVQDNRIEPMEVFE